MRQAKQYGAPLERYAWLREGLKRPNSSCLPPNGGTLDVLCGQQESSVHRACELMADAGKQRTALLSTRSLSQSHRPTPWPRSMHLARPSSAALNCIFILQTRKEPIARRGSKHTHIHTPRSNVRRMKRSQFENRQRAQKRHSGAIPHCDPARAAFKSEYGRRPRSPQPNPRCCRHWLSLGRPCCTELSPLSKILVRGSSLRQNG